MKKICFLGFFLLIFLLSSNTSFAAQDLTATSSSQQQSVSVNYELPYPGLLPDSPLYFLKAIRDRIVSFLISDPLRKAEFDLLQADKRLNAGIHLFNKGKISLALSTVSKAENYFEQALDRIGEAKTQGRNISEMEGNLRNALEKHKQELEKFTQEVSTAFKGNFEKEQKRLVGFEQRLSH